MAADRTRVIKRTLEILNLPDAGGYTAAISARNKTRNLLALTDAIDEAGLAILKAIAERPNEFRYQFATAQAITVNPTQLSPHIGPPISVRIVPYSGATAIDGKAQNHDQINSWRENPSQVYDAINHNAVGSTLSGAYAVWQDLFYFTGFSASVTLARLPVRADTAALIPEVLENVWINLAVGNAAKVGTGGYEMPLIAEYANRGARQLEEFKAGGRMFAETDTPEMPVEVHNVARP